jgi:hypothetical protein
MSGKRKMNNASIVVITHALDPTIKTAPVILACIGKLVFTDKSSANKSSGGQRPYRCNLCEKWHLSTRTTKLRPRDTR